MPPPRAFADGVESNKGVYMDFADGTFIIGVCLFYVGIAAVIGITIYKVVKIICLTITRNAEVKAFGSSAEYTEFLKWRQEQGRQ